MSVFVKTTNNGSIWSYCYGKDSKKIGNARCIESPYVPLSGKGSFATFPLYNGSRLSWPENEGWIYGYEHKSSKFVHPCRSIRFPKWIPERLRNNSISDVARYVLRSTSIGSIFRRPEVLRAVTEEMYLDTIEPILRTPIFLPTDKNIFDDWSNRRPEAYRFACEDADRVAALYPAHQTDRRLLRLEAHRKIDAEREQFSTTPCLGGEAYVEFGGATGSMKFGRVKAATYPKGEKAETITPAARSEEALTNVENVILQGTMSLDEKLKYLPVQRSFHAFEEANPVPSIGYEYWGEEQAHAGYSRRPGLSEAAASYTTLGIACVVSDPARALIASLEPELVGPEDAAIFSLSKAWLVRLPENN